MLALDIGGTKTSIFFSRRSSMERFIQDKGNAIIRHQPEERVCIISSKFFTKSQDDFENFFNYLRELDEEIISTFPGIVRMKKRGESIKFVAYTKKFGFSEKLEPDVDFLVNDVYAFAYHHADRFFKKKENASRTMLAVQIGTGLNAVHMNFYDFNEMLFLNKIIEAGHITMRQGQDECMCGRKGCAELYVSGRFLEKLGKGDYRKVFEDQKLKKEFYENLTDYLSSLIITFSPDKLVLGGSVAKSVDIKLVQDMVKDKFPYIEFELGLEYDVDTSSISNLKGLMALYKNFRKKYGRKLA